MSDTIDDDTIDDIDSDDMDESNGGKIKGYVVIGDDGNAVYKYAKHTIELNRLPAPVVNEALCRAFNHIMSNEAKSKSGTAIDKLLKEDKLTNEPTAIEAERKELETAFRDRYIAAMYAGTWGQKTSRESGPRLSSLQTEYNRILGATVTAVMKANPSVRYDKETKLWWWFLADNVTKETRTIEQAMERWVSVGDRHADMMQQAQAALDVKRRQAQTTADAAKAAASIDF